MYFSILSIYLLMISLCYSLRLIEAVINLKLVNIILNFKEHIITFMLDEGFLLIVMNT